MSNFQKTGLIAAFTLLSSAAFAQDYSWQPDRPINIIVPWSAGGSTDQVTRVVAPILSEALGVEVVVVNQPVRRVQSAHRPRWMRRVTATHGPRTRLRTTRPTRSQGCSKIQRLMIITST